MRKISYGIKSIMGMVLGLFLTGAGGFITVGKKDFIPVFHQGCIRTRIIATYDGIRDRSGAWIPAGMKASLIHDDNHGAVMLPGRWSRHIPGMWGLHARGMRSRKRYPPEHAV